jgi:hypothetical protein
VCGVELTSSGFTTDRHTAAALTNGETQTANHILLVDSLQIREELLHYKENPIYVFLFWELHGLNPNFQIHVSVRNSFSPRIGPHVFLQQTRQTDPWKYMNLSQIYVCRNWEAEHNNSVSEITVYF